MHVYSTELGIRVSFGKTSEFPPPLPLGTPLFLSTYFETFSPQHKPLFPPAHNFCTITTVWPAGKMTSTCGQLTFKPASSPSKPINTDTRSQQQHSSYQTSRCIGTEPFSGLTAARTLNCAATIQSLFRLITHDVITMSADGRTDVQLQTFLTLPTVSLGGPQTGFSKKAKKKKAPLLPGIRRRDSTLQPAVYPPMRYPVD
jgi:hypothetical protein